MSDDSISHNIPKSQVTGRENLREGQARIERGRERSFVLVQSTIYKLLDGSVQRW